MSEFDCKKFARQMRENAVKDYNGNIICSPELWEKIASIVERQPQTAEWIKVSERLPKPVEYDWVLVNIMFNEDGSYGVPNVAEYRKGEWWDFFDNKLSDLNITVTHWQPFPPPPTEIE